MTCETVETHLPAYIDGELPAAERDAVTAHLDTCGTCREMADQFALLETVLAGRRDGLPDPAQTFRAVMARTGQSRSLRILKRLVSVPALALFLFLSVGSLLYIQRAAVGSLFAREIPLMDLLARAADRLIGSLVTVAGGDVMVLAIIYGGMTLLFLLAMGATVQNIVRSSS